MKADRFRGSRRSLSGRSAKTAGKWLVAYGLAETLKAAKKPEARRRWKRVSKGVGERGHPDQQLLLCQAMGDRPQISQIFL